MSLLLLAERAGTLVAREEILQCLPSESNFADFEHGISFSIDQIRGALADNAEKPRRIETLPLRGYRFIAPVHARSSGQKQAKVAAGDIDDLESRLSIDAKSPKPANRLLRFTGFVLVEGLRRCFDPELQRKLNLPRRVVRTGHYHLAERRTNRTSSNLISGRYLVRCGVVVLVVRNEIARSVCQIKDLRADPQLYSFRYREVLKNRERKITEVPAIKGVAAGIAYGAQKWRARCK